MNTNTHELATNPFSAVLLQMQYTPLLNIEHYIAPIQDMLRKLGYPLCHTMKGDIVQLTTSGDLEKKAVEQWMLVSSDYQKALILDAEKCTFQVFDTQANSLDAIVREFEFLVHTLDTILDFSIITRLGLRCIQSIVESTNLSWKTIVQKGFLGSSLPVDIPWTGSGWYNFALQRTIQLQVLQNPSIFQVRILQNPSGRLYPDDILRDPRGLTDFVTPQTLVTCIDLDHYGSVEYIDKQTLLLNQKEIFHAFYAVIMKVFLTTITTKEAHALWS